MTEQYAFLLKTSQKIGQRFKTFCKSQGITINRGIELLMKQASNGSFKLRQSIREKKVKS